MSWSQLHCNTGLHCMNSIRCLKGISGVMAGLAIVFVFALFLDPRLVEGVPAWLKPAKFAVSLSLYGFTFAWILRQLSAWPRVVCLGAWATILATLIEMALIGMQAGRAVPSHFNTGTRFDAAVFAIMGIAILAQTLSAGAVAFAAWRQTFTDGALGWAVRLGLTLTVLGASIGGLMTRPTESQLSTLQMTGKRPRTGAHSVGGNDGGPGLTGLRWSTEHGDLRVAHFLGLHAMQAIPLLAWLTRHWRSRRSRLMLILGAGGSYGSLLALLLAQALAGEPVVSPSGRFLYAFTIWGLATAAFAVVVWWSSRREVSGIASPTQDIS